MSYYIMAIRSTLKRATLVLRRKVLLAVTVTPPSLRGVPLSPFSPLLLLLLLSTSLALRRSALRLPLVGDAAPARARGARVVEGAAGEAVGEVEATEEVEVVVGVVPGVGASVAAVEVVAAVAEEVEAAAAVVEVAEEVVLVEVQPRSVEALVAASASSSCAPVRPRRFSSFVSGTLGVGGLGVQVPALTFFAPALVVGRCVGSHTTQRCFGRLTDAWHTQFPDAVELPRWHDLLLQNVPIFDLDFDAILAAMYAFADITEGDCYLRVPPDLGTVAAALGASAAAALGARASTSPGAGTSPLSGTAPTESFHTFTLDSGALCSFFRDSTTLTPLSRPVAVSLADPSGGPVLAHYSTVLPCPTAPSGLLSGLHLPSFSTNLVSRADLQDAWVDQFTPGGQRVTHCTCSRTGRHLATFTHRPGSSLYTMTTAPPPVLASGQVAASSQVFAAASRSSPASAPCSCRPLAHETLLWHHRLGHPSLPRLRGMASRALVSGLPRSLPPLPPGPAPTCVPCVKGRQRAAPHSSSFPPTEAPLQTLHMDVWGPARVRGQGHERYFLLVVDDYSRYTTVFPLRSKGEVPEQSTQVLSLRGAEPAGAGTGGAESGRAVPGGAEPRRVEPEGTVSGGAEPARAASGGALGVPPWREPLSPQQLREWYSWHCQGDAGASGGGAYAGAAGGGAGARAAGGAAGAGAAGGAAGTGDPGAEGTGSVSAVCGGAVRPRPYYVPLLQQVLGSPPSPGPPPPSLSPPPVPSQSQLQPASPLPGPSPYSRPTRDLTEHREPESRPVSPVSRSTSPVRSVRAGRVSRPRLPPVPGTHSMTLCPSTTPQRVPLPSPPASTLPAGPDPASDSLRAARPAVTRFLATAVTDPLFESTAASALVAAACRLDFATSLVAESASASASVRPPSVEGECALGTDVLEDRQEEFECFAASVPHLVSMLLAPEGDPDAPDIPTPRSYAEAIEGPYSSQWQAAMDAEMASWKSTLTYVDEVPPPGANIVSGMWIFRVKRPPGSLPVFKARYVARGFSQRQGVDFFQTFSPTPKMTTLRILLHVAAQHDYELHSLDFSTAFLQGSLHEEIWLRRPPGFSGSFPTGTQWSLRRPVYSLRQAPREWHDTLRTTLAALGFAPSTSNPSLFLRTDTTLLMLTLRHSPTAQRTITLTQSHMVQQVLQRFDFTYSSPQSTPLPTGHSLSAPPSDESVEPSGPYPELVGCLISSCEAEIYAGAMATQELRWLTYLLTDLGEAPRSPPVLYVDNKAMLALCQEHRSEHRTKHIALRYFLARELHQRGQLRLAYVASHANTADVFTKALQPCDHQHLCTVLGLERLLQGPGAAAAGAAAPGAAAGAAAPGDAAAGAAAAGAAAAGAVAPGAAAAGAAAPGAAAGAAAPGAAAAGAAAAGAVAPGAVAARGQ
ncbi:unnamed protein product [Closterium sp. NIES-54]